LINDESRDIEYWRQYGSKMSGATAVGIVGLQAMVFLLVIILSITPSGTAMISTPGIGLLWGVSIMALLAQYIILRHFITSYQYAPTKIIRSKDGIKYLDIRKNEQLIEFGKIKAISTSVSNRGGIFLVTGDGNRTLGPGCGGDFGKKILLDYVSWLESNNRRAKITQSYLLLSPVYKVSFE